MNRITFNPQNNQTPPFITEVNLDGSPYILSALWNVYGQRWYVKLTTNAGHTVQTAPLIGSPASYDIPLFPGLFNDQVVYREAASQFEIGSGSANLSTQQQSGTKWADMVQDAINNA